MKALRIGLASLLLLTITACSSLGVPKPQNFNEAALSATASINAASQTVLTLLQARKISPDESDRYTSRLEQAQLSVDTIRKLHTTDPGGAAAQLDGLILMLETLQSELRGRQ